MSTGVPIGLESSPLEDELLIPIFFHLRIILECDIDRQGSQIRM